MSFEETLRYGADELDRLASLCDIPVEGRSEVEVVVIGMTAHARALVRTIRRACGADDLVGAMLALRSLTEAVILVRWLEIDPANHLWMYLAEDKRHSLEAAGRWKALARKRRWQARTIFTSADVRTMWSEIHKVRKEALERHEPLPAKGNVCLPTVEKMALAAGSDDVWEAYEIIYRVASPWTHVGGRALSGHQLVAKSDGHHIVPGMVWTEDRIRSLALPVFAALIGSTSRICRLGIEVNARLIQDAVAKGLEPGLIGLSLISVEPSARSFAEGATPAGIR